MRWLLLLLRTTGGSCEVGGEVDNELSVYHEVIGGFFQVPCEHLVFGGAIEVSRCNKDGGKKLGLSVSLAIHTIRFRAQFDHIADTNIDNTEEALILFLELLLVEYLDSQDRVLSHPAA